MDVKSSNTQIIVTVPATYQRAVPLVQQVSLPSSPVSPDDIVDCVELRSGKTSQANRQIIRYSPPDSSRIKEKGKFVDIWA